MKSLQQSPEIWSLTKKMEDGYNFIRQVRGGLRSYATEVPYDSFLYVAVPHASCLWYETIIFMRDKKIDHR